MIFHNESENFTYDEQNWENLLKNEHIIYLNFTDMHLSEAEVKYNKDQVQGQGQDEHDIQSFIVSVCVIFVASLSSTIETVIISGSPLKDGNTVILPLWYFIIGATFSMIVSLVFEHPFIPDNIYDVTLFWTFYRYL